MRVNLPEAELLFRSAGDFMLPGGLTFSPSYLQAGALVLMIFLLILTLGQLRRRLVNWKIGGILPGVFLGFVLALIIEGIFVVGGRTVLTEMLGWESAPKPIVKALDAGRNKLVGVLGVTDEVPMSNAASTEIIITYFDELSLEDQESLREAICIPQ